MKRIILLLTIILFSSKLMIAQDVIIQTNGEEIKSKIIEITKETIKYHQFGVVDPPIRNIDISDVFMIVYENGKRELYTTINSSNAKNGKYIMLGAGIGVSYGGLGAKFELGTNLYAFNFGLGKLEYFSFSAGVKLFIYDELYINYEYFNAELSDQLHCLLIGTNWNYGIKSNFVLNFAFGIGKEFDDDEEDDVDKSVFLPAFDLGFSYRF